VIWREVFRLRDSGKPVVASMGDVAASGGYYIACPADVIVALPATLTGSIGVFGFKLVVDACWNASDSPKTPCSRARAP
jgi:protease-4